MGKKKVQKENQEVFGRLKNVYRRKCEVNNVQGNKGFKDKLEVAEDNGQMKGLQLTEPVGPVGLRSIIDSLIEVEYTGLKILTLFKVNAEDEGLRIICNYLNKYHSIEELSLVENGITQLGCEFLGKSLGQPQCPILRLKLNNNPIRTEGLYQLSLGLKLNNTIKKLALKDCEIDEDGGRIIQTILANINCKISDLKLSQNLFRERGLVEILKVLRCNDSVSKLTIRDIGVQFVRSVLNEEQQMALQLLKQIMTNSPTIKWYDLRFNPLTTQIASELIDIVETNKAIEECRVSETMEIQLKTRLRLILDSRVSKPSKKMAAKK